MWMCQHLRTLLSVKTPMKLSVKDWLNTFLYKSSNPNNEISEFVVTQAYSNSHKPEQFTSPQQSDFSFPPSDKGDKLFSFH